MAKRPTPQHPAPQPPHQHQHPDGPGIGFTAVDDGAHPGPDAEQVGHGAHTGTEPPPPQPQPQPNYTTAPGLPPWPVNPPVSFTGWQHPGTDAKGHQANVNLKLMPITARQMGLVVGSGRFPYRTTQELIRHAIYQHLEWLSTIDGSVPSVMAQVDSINTMVNDEQMLQEQSEVLARHLAVTEKHLTMGDFESAQRVVDRAITSIDGMPPGAWRDMYRQKFADLYKFKDKPKGRVTAGTAGTAGGGHTPAPLPAPATHRHREDGGNE